MAVVQSSQIVLKVLAQLANASVFGAAQDNIAQDYTLNLGNGSGAGQAAEYYHAQRTLALSATEDLDLSGSLLDALGATVAFTKLKLILIFAAAGNTNDVKVGAGNTTVPIFGATTHFVLVKPGAFFALSIPTAAGVAIANASTDLLTVTNAAGGTSVTYDLHLIGA